MISLNSAICRYKQSLKKHCIELWTKLNNFLIMVGFRFNALLIHSLYMNYSHFGHSKNFFAIFVNNAMFLGDNYRLLVNLDNSEK